MNMKPVFSYVPVSASFAYLVHLICAVCGFICLMLGWTHVISYALASPLNDIFFMTCLLARLTHREKQLLELNSDIKE